MLFAFRNTLLIVKKIAVLIWGQKHCRGYERSFTQSPAHFCQNMAIAYP